MNIETLLIWSSSCGRIELSMTLDQAESVSGPGDQDGNIQALLKQSDLQQQIDQYSDTLIASTLKEYGCWNDDDLQYSFNNTLRLVWIAGCELTEEMHHNEHINRE